MKEPVENSFLVICAGEFITSHLSDRMPILRRYQEKPPTSCTASYNAWADHYCHYYYLAPSETPGVGALPMTGDMRFTEPEASDHKS